MWIGHRKEIWKLTFRALVRISCNINVCSVCHGMSCLPGAQRMIIEMPKWPAGGWCACDILQNSHETPSAKYYPHCFAQKTKNGGLWESFPRNRWVISARLQVFQFKIQKDSCMVKEETLSLEWKTSFGFLRRNGHGGSLVVFVCCPCDHENESRRLEPFDGFLDAVSWSTYRRSRPSSARSVAERWKIPVFFLR